MFNEILRIFLKDLRIEFRSKHTISLMILFAMVTIMIIGFSIGPFDIYVSEVGPGLLWVVFLFAGMLGFGRTVIREKEMGTLEGLKIIPLDSLSIFIGKTIFNFTLMLIVEALTLPIFFVITGYNIKGSIGLAFLLIILGTIGIVIVGSMMSALIINAKYREMLLPVITLPLLIPIVILATLSLKKVLTDGAGFYEVFSEIKLMLMYIVIMSVISTITFDYSIEE